MAFMRSRGAKLVHLKERATEGWQGKSEAPLRPRDRAELSSPPLLYIVSEVFGTWFYFSSKSPCMSGGGTFGRPSFVLLIQALKSTDPYTTFWEKLDSNQCKQS